MPGRLLAGASLTALGAGAGAALYAWRESTWVEATERVVRLAGLPAGLEGLRILHVSDTHFPADGASLPRFLETVSGLEFDLVLASGDYVETSAGWETAARGLTSLAARWGVYATLGAHDYCEPVRTAGEWASSWRDRALGRGRRFVDPSPFVTALESGGVRVLRNEWVSAEIGGELVRIGGAGDDSVGLARLERALPPEEVEPAGFTLLITHSPDAMLETAPGRAVPSLVLCGHTHGGQIRAPWYGAPVRHSQLVDRRRTAGEFERGGSRVVVSRGFGTAMVPLRFLCRPEIGVIELRSEADGEAV